MSNRHPDNGASGRWKSLAGLLVAALLLPLSVSCSSFKNDKAGSQQPAISSFYVTNNANDTFTVPKTSLTVTKGDSVYLMARYATSGSATITPGNFSPTSNVIQPAGVVNQDTTFTLSVANLEGTTVTSTVQVQAVDAPDATITAPASALRGAMGLIASVPAVAGSSYLWTITNGTITAGTGTSTITFTAGSAGTGGAAGALTLSCQVTNAAGRSTTTPVPLQVVVNAQPPATLTYAHNPASYYVNVAAPVNTPSLGGGDPVQLFSVTPSLPAGLTLDGVTGLISGTPTVVVTQGSYVITAANTGGATTATVLITVQAQPAVTLTANPATIGTAGGSILSWSVDGTVASITVDQGVQTTPLSTATIKAGTFNVSPAVTTTYTLTANLVAGGTVTAQAKVTVDATPLAIASFTADANPVLFGGSTALHWQITGTPNVLTLDGASVFGNSSAVIYPVRREAYVLSAGNGSPLVSVNQSLKVAARGLDLVAGSIAGPGASNSATATKAQFNGPQQIAKDAAGNLYVADTVNHLIRMISTSGVVTTVAGQPGVRGTSDTAAGTALFYTPRGIAVTADGNTIYVGDNCSSSTGSIRMLVKGGSGWTVSTVVPSSAGLKLNYGQVRLDPSGQFLLIADSSNNQIKVLRLSDNTVQLYAGSTAGHAEAVGASFSTLKMASPEGMAFNKAGTYFYVTEYGNNCIRMIPWIAPAATGAMTTPTGTSFTIAGPAAPAANGGYLDGAGTSALFNKPVGIDVDGNDLVWVADTTSSVIRTLSITAPGNGTCTVATVAGTTPGGTVAAPVAVTGSNDGAAASASFNSPYGLVCVGANVYISDTNNASIRLLSGGTVSTPIGTSRQFGTTDAKGSLARFNAPQGVAVFGGYAYVADTGNNSLRKVSLADGTTTTVATGFTQIKGVAVDAAGLVYVTDNGTAPAKAVIQVASDGTKTTILQGLFGPQNLAVSPVNPNLLYVVDGNAILEITMTRNPDGSLASATTTKTIGVTGASTPSWADGAFGTARFKTTGFFSGLAVDASGNIFVADEGNSCIRKIAASTYTVSTIAGIGAVQTAPATNYGYIDGLPTNKFNFPMGIVVDGAGNVYVAENGNHSIRKIAAADGTASSLVGQPFVDATLAPNGAPGKFGATAGALGGGASLYKPFGLALTTDGDLLVTTNDGLMQVTAP